MTWTAPRTWVAGETVTDSICNVHIRDNFNAVGDPWTAYTPTWTATTNPSIGNGTLAGKYRQAGKTVHFAIRVVMGSTTTFGSGAWFFGFPVNTASSLPTGEANGHSFDNSAGIAYAMAADLGASSSSTGIYVHGGGLISATVPFTWAASDVLQMSGTYESA